MNLCDDNRLLKLLTMMSCTCTTTFLGSFAHARVVSTTRALPFYTVT